MEGVELCRLFLFKDLLKTYPPQLKPNRYNIKLNMLKNKKYILYISVIFLIGTIVVFSLLKEEDTGKQLLKKGRYSIATITSFRRIGRKRSFFDQYEPVYKFKVKGQDYSGKGFGIIQLDSKFHIQMSDTGSRYLVVFLPDNPEINSLLPYEKILDSLPNIPIEIDGHIQLVKPNVEIQIAPEDGWTRQEKFNNGHIEHLNLSLTGYDN